MFDLIPAFQLSRWMQWRDCNSDASWVGLTKRPGIYLLSHFEDAPNGAPALDRLNREIFYVGAAIASLEGRLQTFGQCLRSGNGRHAAASGYYQDSSGSTDRLHVSIFPWPECDPSQTVYFKQAPDFARRSTYLNLVERLVLWRYVEQWGELPRHNKY
jgi:hypothetical protein